VRASLHLLVTIAILGALVSLAEWADPEVGGVRRDEVRRDAMWLLLYLAYTPWVVVLSAAIGRAAGDHSPVAAAAAHGPWWVRLVIAIVAAELTYYALHRWFHTSALWWRVHRVHHSSTDLHWWSSFRFHPLEVVVVQIVPASAAALLGAGSTAVVYTMAATVVTIFSHADVYVPGRWLDRVVATPCYHRSHHETGRERTNYALVLPLVDIVCGTASFARSGVRRFGSVVTATPTRGRATQCWPTLPRRARQVPPG
jgi:sterol desaturase/sphingolipid hydroxylase (fatty acid hydroxylase superfamily)